MTAAVGLLLFVTLQRLGELALAKRNTERLIAAGAYEAGSGHYIFIVALHTLWLIGLWLFVVVYNPPVDIAWVIIFLALQLLRVWVIASLGPRWTTRIIVTPGAKPVNTGPYRVLSHPNYAVVVGEIFALPMAFGMVGFAILFSVLNAIVLFIRIREEDQALSDAASQVA